MTRPHLTFHARRLLLASLLSLPFSGACSDEEATVVPPVDISVAITTIDGSEPDASDSLLCTGTLVQVAISPARSFTLRPLDACSRSTRCGYLHIEGLDGNDEVLGSVDSVTPLGLLELPVDALPQLAAIRVVLLRGIDAEPVTNSDLSVVEARVEVSRPAPTDCGPDGAGGQGQGGASAGAGAPGLGGAGVAGTPAGGATAAGAPAGGAPTSDLGGAGGAPTDPSAGSGGV